VRVSFDGCGLNDTEGPYRQRIATFMFGWESVGKEIERRINAYDYLKQLLKDRGFSDARLEMLITRAEEEK
jgi:hypothetical protein